MFKVEVPLHDALVVVHLFESGEEATLDVFKDGLFSVNEFYVCDVVHGQKGRSSCTWAELVIGSAGPPP